MFTVDQIEQSQKKVKSGADFPSLIQNLKKLGVTHYETYVSDGHTDFYGANGYRTSTTSKYNTLTVAAASNKEEFSLDLKTHQDGQTDYMRFCKDAAKSGIEKWAVSMDEMTCTYYDRSGSKILIEAIPAPKS